MRIFKLQFLVVCFLILVLCPMIFANTMPINYLVKSSLNEYDEYVKIQHTFEQISALLTPSSFYHVPSPSTKWPLVFDRISDPFFWGYSDHSDYTYRPATNASFVYLDRNSLNRQAPRFRKHFRDTSSAPVPEPSTWVMLSTGLVGLGLYGWRRKKTVPT
jgi:hypothetical protein